jgi:hypothetical protein
MSMPESEQSGRASRGPVVRVIRRAIRYAIILGSSDSYRDSNQGCLDTDPAEA